MVLLKTTISGIALLVLGILAMTVMGQYVTVEVQDVQRRDVVTHAEFDRVGDVAQGNYALPADVSAFGTVDVRELPSNQSGDIHFLVLDAQNFQKWSSGGQADSIISANRNGQFNFTFKSEKGGDYYFVFDNKAFPFKKDIVFSLWYNEIITTRVQDTRIQYLGWALVVIGALLLAYGLMRKPPIPWA